MLKNNLNLNALKIIMHIKLFKIMNIAIYVQRKELAASSACNVNIGCAFSASLLSTPICAISNI